MQDEDNTQRNLAEHVHSLKENFLSLNSLKMVRINQSFSFYFLPVDHLWVLIPDVFMVVTSEIAVDIIKHAFITKFNDITAEVRNKSDIH